MEVKQVKTSEIKTYKRNAKKHSEDQVQAIANSIQKFGFRQPLVLDGNMEIIIGHGRFEAAKKLGMQEVPCVMADDLTEEQVKALRIVDNKTNESEWDFGLLGEELAGLIDFDMTDLGFNEAEIIELQIDDAPEEIPSIQDAEKANDVPAFGIAVPPVGSVDGYVQGGNGNDSEGAFEWARVPQVTKEELSAYAQNAEQMVTRRVIIVYRTDEEEDRIKEMLGISKDERLNVVIDIKNL